MTKSPWSEAQLEGFHEAAQSLKLYRRAELEDPDNSASLIRELYVDPLPRNTYSGQSSSPTRLLSSEERVPANRQFFSASKMNFEVKTIQRPPI